MKALAGCGIDPDARTDISFAKYTFKIKINPSQSHKDDRRV